MRPRVFEQTVLGAFARALDTSSRPRTREAPSATFDLWTVSQGGFASTLEQWGIQDLGAAILSVCTTGILLPRTAAADQWDKRTILTFRQAVEIPSQVLPAGTYAFQLADSPTSRHVVQVFDPEGRMLAMMFTVPTARPAAADDTRITFEEQRAGAPFPIKQWFYPGALSGEEFVYGTHIN